MGSVGRSSIGTASLDNPLYEPNAEEVENFGRFLGLDIFAEGHLIWIAEEGLRMGLPEGWTHVKGAEGEVHFMKASTGARSDSDPRDDELLKILNDERTVPAR